MKILSRYIAATYLRYLTYCILAMLALLIVANMFGNIESVFSGWRNFVEFLEDVIRSLPTMFEIILPMAVLLATVMTFSSLSRSSELVAMKTSGMGMRRLILPVFAVLVPVSALSYLSQNYLFNALNPNWHQGSVLQKGHYWLSDGDKIYYFREIDSKKKRIAAAVIFDWREGPFRALKIRSIRRGRRVKDKWVFRSLTTREERDGVWKLSRKRSLKVAAKEFPDVFRPRELDAHHMPFLDLYEVIRQPENRDANIVVYRLEWYRKFAILAAPFVLVLVGAPLSQFHQRTSRVAGDVVITLFGGVIFWITNEIFLILGKGSLMAPFLSAWGVNFLFILLGFGLLLRTR